MIRASNEWRDAGVGATVNLFISVGWTSRRSKGTVDATRRRGAAGEVLEVRFAEETPGGSEVVIWLGFTEEATFLLPMAVDGDDGVYVRYGRDGGRTGLYVDAAREVSVRSAARPSADRSAVDPCVDGGDERTGNGRNSAR